MTKLFCDICRKELQREASLAIGGKGSIKREGPRVYINVTAEVLPELSETYGHICDECKAVAVVSAMQMWLPPESAWSWSRSWSRSEKGD